MKIEKPKKPDNITIFVAGVAPTKSLKDYRKLQRYGKIHFGSIGQAAKNLGITMKVVEGGLTFTAPRARLQMFVEKLHFSMITYRQIN
jgi:uncharacterized protein YlbG (UPF0298 family)